MKLSAILLATAALVELSLAALDGCSSANAVPLGPNDVVTRVGSNACVTILQFQVNETDPFCLDSFRNINR